MQKNSTMNWFPGNAALLRFVFVLAGPMLAANAQSRPDTFRFGYQGRTVGYGEERVLIDLTHQLDHLQESITDADWTRRLSGTDASISRIIFSATHPEMRVQLIEARSALGRYSYERQPRELAACAMWLGRAIETSQNTHHTSGRRRIFHTDEAAYAVRKGPIDWKQELYDIKLAGKTLHIGRDGHSNVAGASIIAYEVVELPDENDLRHYQVLARVQIDHGGPYVVSAGVWDEGKKNWQEARGLYGARIRGREMVSSPPGRHVDVAIPVTMTNRFIGAGQWRITIDSIGQ